MQDLLIRSPFKYFFGIHKRRVVFGLVALFFTNLLDALSPILIGYAVDQVAEGQGFSAVARTVMVIFSVTLALMFFRYSWRVMWGEFQHRSCEEMQNHIFSKFTNLSQSYLRKRPVGELMSLIINDVQSFRMGIGPGVIILADALFILMIVPALMFYMSASWTWKTMLIMLTLPFVAHFLMAKLFEAYERRQDRFAELSGKAQEIVSGIRVIKSFVQMRAQTKHFNQFSKRFEDACNTSAYYDAWFMPVMESSVAIGRVILLIIGTHDVIQGTVSVGTFSAFYLYIQRMEWPAAAIGYGLSHWQQGEASFKRIKELLLTPSDMSHSGTKSITDFESLEVKNLTYSHSGAAAPTLQNINFTLKRGDVLGIVGAIGSGKSTLVDIISYLLPIKEGLVRINGERIENISEDDLRKVIAVVPQESFLFSDSIQNNVALDREQNVEHLERLLSAVDIHGEVQGLAFKEKTELGERGVNLSGGQKQRLSIARALAREAPLMIIDDAMSAVDSRTENHILSSLQKHFAKSSDLRPSLIIVSHRIDSIKWADQILVLNEGQQEALGSHDVLLKTSPTYLKLYKIQADGGHYEHTVH